MNALKRWLLLQSQGLHVWRDDAYCPDWYALVQSAKYLGVAPWALLEQADIWQRWAQDAMTVEAQVRKALDKG